MICSICNFDERASSEKFVGIFVPGTNLTSTKKGEICFFGCPRCHTVQYTTDIKYISKRKAEYKMS